MNTEMMIAMAIVLVITLPVLLTGIYRIWYAVYPKIYFAKYVARAMRDINRCHLKRMILTTELINGIYMHVISIVNPDRTKEEILKDSFEDKVRYVQKVCAHSQETAEGAEQIYMLIAKYICVSADAVLPEIEEFRDGMVGVLVLREQCSPRFVSLLPQWFLKRCERVHFDSFENILRITESEFKEYAKFDKYAAN